MTTEPFAFALTTTTCDVNKTIFNSKTCLFFTHITTQPPFFYARIYNMYMSHVLPSRAWPPNSHHSKGNHYLAIANCCKSHSHNSTNCTELHLLHTTTPLFNIVSIPVSCKYPNTAARNCENSLPQCAQQLQGEVIRVLFHDQHIVNYGPLQQHLRLCRA